MTNVTITSAQAEELRAVARAHSAHAATQAEWFIEAVKAASNNLARRVAERIEKECT